MGDESLTVAELDDVEDTVYAMGLNLDDVSSQEIDDILELLKDKFDNADWMVLNLPIEGSVEISEMDPSEVEEALAYHDMGEANEWSN